MDNKTDDQDVALTLRLSSKATFWLGFALGTIAAIVLMFEILIIATRRR
jgi:hypothetical protein